MKRFYYSLNILEIENQYGFLELYLTNISGDIKNG